MDLKYKIPPAVYFCYNDPCIVGVPNHPVLVLHLNNSAQNIITNREKFDFGLENTRDTDLSRYFVTVLCRGTLSRYFVTVLCHGTLSRYFVTVLCHGIILKDSIS